MKIKKVYLGRKQIYPDGWNPGENTIVYWKLRGDALDYSGNNRNGTATGVTYQDNGHIQVAVLNGNSEVKYQDNTFNGTLYTESLRWSTDLLQNTSVLGLNSSSSALNFQKNIFIYSDGKVSGYQYDGQGRHVQTATGYVQTNNWYNTVLTYNGTKMSFFINGTKIGEITCGYTGFTNAQLSVGGSFRNQNRFQGKVSDVIYESKERTDQEVTDYFNKTKGNYGL